MNLDLSGTIRPRCGRHHFAKVLLKGMTELASAKDKIKTMAPEFRRGRKACRGGDLVFRLTQIFSFGIVSASLHYLFLPHSVDEPAGFDFRMKLDRHVVFEHEIDNRLQLSQRILWHQSPRNRVAGTFTDELATVFD